MISSCPPAFLKKYARSQKRRLDGFLLRAERMRLHQMHDDTGFNGNLLGQMSRAKIDFDTVRKIALRLPGVEESTAWGSPALKVRGQ